MIKSIIAAMGDNRVIGKNNDLLWRLKDELQYFKKTTMGHHLIVGRKTFESYPKTLPGRTQIILTRQANYPTPEDCYTQPSLEEAFEFAKQRGEDEVFIIGGEEIYNQSIASADRMYLTYVDFQGDADAHFPEFDSSRFEEETIMSKDADERNPYKWVAKLYTKKQSKDSPS